MDNNLLYKILGYGSAVGVNKELTKFAVCDYEAFIRDVSYRLSSMLIDILFQGYNVDFKQCYIYCVLNLDSLDDIDISFDNYGVEVNRLRWELCYTNTDKNIDMSHRTRKSCMFNGLTDEKRDYLAKIVRDTLYELMRNTRVSRTAIARIQFAFEKTSIDASMIKKIIQSYKFNIESEEIKEKPGSSHYMYCFKNET